MNIYKKIVKFGNYCNYYAHIRFENAEKFYVDDRAAVKENGLWGIIDSSGKYILEPRYCELRCRHEYAGGDRITPLFEGKDYIDINGNLYIEE